MSVKRAVWLTVFGLFLLLLWVNLFVIFKELRKLSLEYKQVSEDFVKLEDENKMIERDIAFYSFPANLEKNLREKFNYKKTGEKMIIVVPGN
ncbi:MAG: hypothetical protein WC705_01630 [Candidatus Paceibacterota bacterium]|jgi:cell division protein FtsB